jgi:uncharacterized membrane protein
MGKSRLEAFSDGVLAIIITIMVLELKVPHGDSMEAIRPMLPHFLSYVLSFIYIGIYWNNHHHMLHVTDTVSGGILWANLHLLFWLSLIPVATAWMGESHFAPTPTAVYGIPLLMAAMAWRLLERAILATHGEQSLLARAIGHNLKETLSTVLYVAAVPLAFFQAWISCAIYAGVALMWLVPDRRIERVVQHRKGPERHGQRDA